MALSAVQWCPKFLSYIACSMKVLIYSRGCLHQDINSTKFFIFYSHQVRRLFFALSPCLSSKNSRICGLICIMLSYLSVVFSSWESSKPFDINLTLSVIRAHCATLLASSVPCLICLVLCMGKHCGCYICIARHTTKPKSLSRVISNTAMNDA